MGRDWNCPKCGGWPNTFQSTRPRGARPSGIQYLSQRRCFNPRARVGRDFFKECYFNRFPCFNPRARVGRDFTSLVVYGMTGMFQSTRPRGARLDKGHAGSIFWLFQSTRPRGARRLWDQSDSGSKEVSIHAPTWGATSDLYRLSNIYSVSIHAPTWGAT